MLGLAGFARSLDPRLKMMCALILGPAIWLLQPIWVLGLAAVLFPLVLGLSASQPVGGKMIRSLATFLLFWMVLKAGLDYLSSVPVNAIVVGVSVLGLRLAALLLVGLALALSTSARSLGLGVSWALGPLVGRERAWKVALSLSLMVHFLPLCLSTMNEVKETTSRRCPHFGFLERMKVIPQAVLRSLGQKTWNQTLAIAGRGLESSDSWQPDFHWQKRDSLCAVSILCLAFFVILLP